MGDISEFFQNGVSDSEGLLDLTWLQVDPKEYAKTEILPEQNLDIVPDLKSLWSHEDKPASSYLLPNKADMPRTMGDLSQAHGKVSKEAMVKAARLLVMKTTDAREIQAGLLSRFPQEHLAQAKAELSAVFAERGLLGNLYIASQDFPRCSSNDSSTTTYALRYARTSRFVLAKPDCSGCVHNQSGQCGVFKKTLVASIPYSEKLANIVEQEKISAGKQIGPSKTASYKDRIRAAYLAPDVVSNPITTHTVQDPATLLAPKKEYEPLVVAPVLAKERSLVMDLVGWLYSHRRISASEVRDAAFQVSVASSKAELASLVTTLESLEPIQDASYAGPVHPTPKPNISAQAIMSGLVEASDLLKKKNHEASLSVAESKARPIVALVRRELLKGLGFDAIRTALHLSVDPRDLVETRDFWAPLLLKAGLLGTLYTEQPLFSDCREGATFLTKYASPVRYVVSGEKCKDCVFNRMGSCSVYRKPLIASEADILTPEVVQTSIDNVVASGKAYAGELDSLKNLPPKEALKEVYKVAHSLAKSSWEPPPQRTVVETSWSGGLKPFHETTEYTKAEIVMAARRYMNEGLYGKELGLVLRKRFAVQDIKAARENLRPLMAEQGLQGIFYVDPTLYKDYGRGCEEPSRLFRASPVKYLKVGSSCAGCTFQTVPGHCSKIGKTLVVEPPYTNKAAQQREVLASGSTLVVPPETLVNYGANMLQEYQMQNPMTVDFDPVASQGAPLEVSFGDSNEVTF